MKFSNSLPSVRLGKMISIILDGIKFCVLVMLNHCGRSDTYFLALNICSYNLNLVFIKCEDRYFSRDEWFKEFAPCMDIFIIFVGAA